jgi:predicted NAD-dependent protein-ADP-ribosyltransferase YbiA (DUF1768 family)
MTEVDRFWRGRQNDPVKYTFTDDGDAKILALPDKRRSSIVSPEEKEGLREKVIKLQQYRRRNDEEMDELFGERKILIQEAYANIEEKRTVLREALLAYRDEATPSSASAVVRANKEIGNAERRLCKFRSGQRSMMIYFNPVANTILLDNPYDKRRLGYSLFGPDNEMDAYIVKRHTLPKYQDLYVEMSPDEASMSNEVRDEFVFVHDDWDNKNLPLLGLYRLKNIEIGPNRYNSLLQAIFVETILANPGAFAVETEVAKLKAQTKQGGIRKVAEEIGIESEHVTDEVLDKVISEAVLQWNEPPENFREALLATGDKDIVYIAPKPRSQTEKVLAIFGTGIIEGKPSINAEGEEILAVAGNQKRKEAWVGENKWGQALQRMRTEVRDKAAGGQDLKGGARQKITWAAKTAKQQEFAKRGAIIRHHMTRKHGH